MLGGSDSRRRSSGTTSKPASTSRIPAFAGDSIMMAHAAAPSAFERPGAARKNPGLAAMGVGSRRGFVQLENGDPAARAGTLGARRVDTTPW